MKRHEVSSELLVTAISGDWARWLEMLIHGLIRHAAQSVPPSLAERLEEEWFADLAVRQRAISRLRFAAGCYWASRVITHELGATVRAPAAATPSSKGVNIYAQPDPSLLSPRTITILFILFLHALAIYVLATGLGPRVIKDITDPLKLTFFSQPQPAVELPPPPQPKFVRPTLVDEFPPPAITIDRTEPNVTQTLTGGVQEATPSQPTAKLPRRVVGGPGPGFPNTEDYYPAASRRLGEKGLATVRVCVDAVGRLIAAPLIAQSSGSARLDEGALKLAKAGSGHYRSTTEDGHPVSSCYPYRIRFELRN